MDQSIPVRDAGPSSDLDPFADDFLVDPFPALTRLRDTGSVVHLSRYDVWAVARHHDVHAVLRDHQRFSSAAGGLAFAVLAFAHHPEQWELVRDDPSLARNAFDEVIRHQSPVTGFFRTTTTDVTWDDVVIPARRKVMVLFAGANRDPRYWDRPDEFDVRRRTTGNLGYGAGPHVCAGMTIARMEGEALIRAMATRVGSWHLEGDPEPRLNNSLRGLSRLPVRAQPL